MVCQEPHGFHVERVRGSPEGRGALEVDAARSEHAERVLHIPEVLVEADVRIGTSIEQSLHHLKMARFLLLMLGRVSIGRPWLPLALEHRVQWRGPGRAGDRRIGSVLEQNRGEIPLPVDGSHQQRRGVVTGRLVDVRATLEERQRGLDVSLPNGVVDRSQSAPLTHLLSVGHRPRGRFTLIVGLSLGALFGLGSLVCSLLLLVGLSRVLRLWSLVRRLFFLLRHSCLLSLPRALAFFVRRRLADLFFFLPVLIVRDVRPVGLHRTRKIDRGLHLARGRLPAGSTSLLLLEDLEHVLQSLFGRLVRRSHLDDVNDEGSRVGVGASVEQHPDRLDAVHRRGEDEGRLPPRGFSDLDVGTVFDESGHDRGAAGTSGQVQWRGTAVRRNGGGVTPRLEQNVDDRAVALTARDVEWRVTPDTRAGVHPGAGVDQDSCQFHVVVPSRPVQSGHPVSLGLVYVRPIPQEGTDGLDFTAHGRVGYRSLERRHAPEYNRRAHGDQRLGKPSALHLSLRSLVRRSTHAGCGGS